MTEKVQSHDTRIEMVRPIPPEVDAGIDITLKVEVSCADGCDLRDGRVSVLDQSGAVVMEATLASFEQPANETEAFTVKAPAEVGECVWRVVFPTQEIGGMLHEESSTPVTLRVKPHTTSLAVWDVPLPVVMGSRFKMKVGVKCSANCQLTGQTVEVYDQDRAKAAAGRLGEAPWPQTSALYWADVEVAAPDAEGVQSWTAEFPPPELELPHTGASSTFGFRSARPGEHTVAVEVVDKETKAPVKAAEVRLNFYEARTNEDGVARLKVPGGEYKLYVSKDQHETVQTALEVAQDVTTKVELAFAPEFTG